MNFKKIILFLCGIIYFHSCKAQPFVAFDVSQVFSKFKFTDSGNNKSKDYNYNLVNAYNLGYLKASQKGLMLGINVGLRKGGATKQIGELGFAWNFQYADAKINVGYMLKKWRIRPYILVSPYYASLINATQIIGEKRYDIKKNKIVSKDDFGVISSGGVNIKLSDFISLYSSFNLITGLKNIETTPSQKLNNRGFSITLGIAINITKSAPQWLKR